MSPKTKSIIFFTLLGLTLATGVVFTVKRINEGSQKN